MHWKIKKCVGLRHLGRKARVEIIAREEGDTDDIEVYTMGDAREAIFGLVVALSRSMGELLANADMNDAEADQKIAEICEKLKNTMRYEMREARARRNVRHTDDPDA